MFTGVGGVHIFGTQTYSDEQTLCDIWITGVIALVEGYHNLHYAFPNDYSNGVCWYDIDLTKWVLWALEQLGVARGLKRFPRNKIMKKKENDHHDQKRTQLSDISADPVAQDVLSHLVDGKVTEIQGMLRTLADKAEAVEQGATDEDDKVADAYSDMVRAERAVGSFESWLDVLLDRLDGLLDQPPVENNTDDPSTSSALNNAQK
ncbi:hypothetical protein EV175_004743 [Coemansia sp. RSA 1933]|nr:hypothetical protein EV175_004743 [Coemansia sp. RSA 1933]